MKSTIEWIDAAKAAQGLTSDYQLAAHWNVTRQLISAYRNRREYLSEETAAKVAADTGVSLGYILACAAGERARMPESRAAWADLAARLGGTAAAVLFALLLTEPLFNESMVLPIDQANAQLCVLCQIHMVPMWAVILFILFNLLPFIPNKKN